MIVYGTRISTADNTVIKHNVTWLHCLMVAILIVLTAVINQFPLVARRGQILIQAIPGLVPPGLKPWYWSYFQWTFRGVEQMVVMSSPWNYGHHSILAFPWSKSGHLAAHPYLQSQGKFISPNLPISLLSLLFWLPYTLLTLLVLCSTCLATLLS